jgi:glycosyltransferase involved in cell wall biosynthesis
MPTFNRAATVARAIESVLGQTLADFELIVSDNASADETETICRRYAADDPRIRYTRHPAPIGGFENFRFVLETARAPLFMWLPADDYMLPALLERAVAVLGARPDVVCCVPRIEFVEPDGRRWRAPGTFALLGSAQDNLHTFLRDPRDNSRFYGLYRRAVLRRVLPASGYYAFDWVVSVGTLVYGRHWELDDVLLVREASDPSRYMRLIDEVASGQMSRLFPLVPFTHALIAGGLGVPLTARTMWLLVRLNVIFHVMSCRRRYPRYSRVVERLGIRFDWLTGRALGRS